MKARRIIGYIVGALALVLCVVLIFRLVPSVNIETAEVILPTPVPTSEALPVQTKEPEKETVGVNPKNVQAALGVLPRAESYSRTVTAESYWSGGSKTLEIDVWVSGLNTRINIHDAAEKNVLIKDEEMWIWYADNEEPYHGKADFKSADEYQQMTTYEDIFSLSPNDIKAAGYDKYGDEFCIFAEYVSGRMEYTTKIWVSAKTGLLMCSETYDDETLIHRVYSSSPDISTQEDSIFTPPGD